MLLNETQRFDWSKVRSAGSAVGIPQAIMDLRDANTEEEAEAAYWEIDNVAVLQGGLFEAAEHTIPCVLSVLNDSKPAGRSKLLELLFQLGGGAGVAHPFEAGHGTLICRKNV